MRVTRASNQNVTNVSLVKYIFNIREWISPHLDKIKYHTEPHVFLFKKNRLGKAVMFYKQWSHCSWEPDNDGCLLLKVRIQVKMHIGIAIYVEYDIFVHPS